MSPSVQPVQWSTDYKDKDYDGILLVSHGLHDLPVQLDGLKSPLQDHSTVDCGLGEEVVVVRVPGFPGDRLVYAPTGPVNRDYDDVRRFSDAAANGIKRAMKAGMQRPLLVCPPHNSYENSTLVAVLGALQALYMVAVLGVWVKEQAQGEEIMELASALESGRVVYRDIGGSDPERMAAPRVAEYVTEVFRNTCVQVSVMSDVHTLEKEYPCLAAVNRCASTVPRHQARVIHLEYKGEEPIEQTLMFVGKGVTYDTGGADIKAGGFMAGMHRDKCGSAAVAGFFQILAKLKPKHLKVMGAMAMVRNSVGSDCYVADELIVSRAGRRIRVGNTDAEGRMAMVDLLCEMKEKAADEVSPHMFTIATLTGHAIRAMGPHYSIILDNGAARHKAGELLGDMFEVSTLRREDYDFHKGKSEYEEILQAGNLPSTATPRGHQSPAAFLVMASGLDKHGLDSDCPLPFSHIDIAGSSGPFPGVPTGAPLLAMATKYILQL